MDERDTPDIQGILALAIGIVAWVSFLVAFFVADDPFLFLLFAILCGVVALVMGIRARREETAAAAAGATAAGAALLYGVSVVAALTAMVYAMGVLLMLVMIFFLMILFAGGSASRSGWGCGGGGSGGGSDPGCCCDDCCDDCGESCCDCGCSACDCGCGDCGCGGCGGCGCIGFGIVLPHVGHGRGFRARLRTLLARGMPHHPDLPEFAADVYVVNGARWCIGCFTTYPVFLVATALLIAFTPPWGVSLALGMALAATQAISSLGLARRRWVKILVKGALGVGLALVVSGIHSSPWSPAWKVGALRAALGLAYLSALPRAKRMRKIRERTMA